MENNSNTDLFQAVRCPNCGNWAERHFYSISQRISTECATCDYLMVTSAVTGSVIEAYAPGNGLRGAISAWQIKVMPSLSLNSQI